MVLLDIQVAMFDVLQLLSSAMEAHPVLTMSAINGFLATLGDIMAQSLCRDTKASGSTKDQSDEKSIAARTGHDWTRTARFVLYALYYAPLLGLWYTCLDAMFPMPPAGIDRAPQMYQYLFPLVSPVTQAVSGRVIADQLLWAPVSIAFFLFNMTVLEGGGKKELSEKFKASYPSALKANYFVWPLLDVINFALVPPMYRVIFTSVGNLFWNTFLSWVNSRTPEPENRICDDQELLQDEHHVVVNVLPDVLAPVNQEAVSRDKYTLGIKHVPQSDEEIIKELSALFQSRVPPSSYGACLSNNPDLRRCSVAAGSMLSGNGLDSRPVSVIY
ncbi:hypothetical protein H4219_001612 [Mycoemilia scoparia]|uniref:Uncharacterized protein n=1 Tax=Mycoemilia scoparia TaxID=417184 RepID=A0A9W8DV77_9FUNG|nr:hypothetical protein H4219_001612 [Mycoemilia scoparia]